MDPVWSYLKTTFCLYFLFQKSVIVTTCTTILFVLSCPKTEPLAFYGRSTFLICNFFWLYHLVSIVFGLFHSHKVAWIHGEIYICFWDQRNDTVNCYFQWVIHSNLFSFLLSFWMCTGGLWSLFQPLQLWEQGKRFQHVCMGGVQQCRGNSLLTFCINVITILITFVVTSLLTFCTFYFILCSNQVVPCNERVRFNNVTGEKVTFVANQRTYTVKC